MPCPACQSQNEASSVRCIQCGTTLIYEAEGHSSAYKQGAAMIDRLMYSGIGAFLGLCLAFLMLDTLLENIPLNKRLVYLASSVAGSLCGRILAWSKWRRS
jgi:ribosomal protein S27E